MTHTSGIRGPSTHSATNYDNLRSLLAQGINLSDKVYQYENQNFALFRILIPYINGFNDAQVADIDSATAQRYLEYMNSVYGHYFAVSCTPGANGRSYALSYSYPLGSNPGFDFGDWQAACGGGGLQLSANELGIFLNQLNQDTFLDAQQLEQMYAGMLGWDQLFVGAGHGDCFAKSGKLNESNGNDAYDTNITTMIAYCPSLDLGFVGIANSLLDSPSGVWDEIVESAFAAAYDGLAH